MRAAAVRKVLEGLGADRELAALVGQAAAFADRENRRALERIPGLDPSRLVGEATVDQFRQRNVRLITTLASEYLDDVAATLADAEGLHVEGVTKLLEDRFDVSKSRAKFWAVDQTLKLNADITRQRMQSAGISRYVWTTSGDERVREIHRELDGQTFSWNDPPVTNLAGDRNNPGQDYRCRCTAYPVLDEGEPEETGPNDVPPPPAFGGAPPGEELHLPSEGDVVPHVANPAPGTLPR